MVGALMFARILARRLAVNAAYLSVVAFTMIGVQAGRTLALHDEAAVVSQRCHSAEHRHDPIPPCRRCLLCVHQSPAARP